MRTADVEFLGELSSADRDALFARSHATLMPGGWPEPHSASWPSSRSRVARPWWHALWARSPGVRDGVDGWFGDSASDLAARVDDVDRLDRAAIRASVLDRFSASRMVEGYLRVYRRALQAA
ncbi:MAG: hypothetical protein R3C32_13790 [Chloroflexota bacterium]